MQEQERLARGITLAEVRAAMKRQFKANVDTPEKLKTSLIAQGKPAVLIATKCGQCNDLFLHLVMGQDLYFYKNYELWNINWGNEASCPHCETQDVLFGQHHTSKVVFDTSNIPDIHYSLGDISALKKPII